MAGKNGKSKGLTPAEILAFEREAAEVEAVSLDRVTTGANNFDYEQLWSLLTAIRTRLHALLSEPKAFVLDGRADPRMYDTVAKLAGRIESLVVNLHKMRNSDRLLEQVLDHFAAKASGEGGAKVAKDLKALAGRIATLENSIEIGAVDLDEVRVELGQIREGVVSYLAEGLTTSLVDAALSTLISIREEFRLH